MQAFMNSIANPIVRWILRSPLHSLLSRSVMLITFRGKKTGRSYTIPVEYHRHNDTITLVTLRSRRWWTNLRSPSPVSVWVEGREVQAIAEQLPANHGTMVSTLRAVYSLLSPQRAEKIADDRILLIVKLASEPEAAQQPARAG